MLSLQEIKEQGLLSPLQLAEVEAWFRSSLVAGEAQDLSPDLLMALLHLVALDSLQPHASPH